MWVIPVILLGVSCLLLSASVCKAHRRIDAIVEAAQKVLGDDYV